MYLAHRILGGRHTPCIGYDLVYVSHSSYMNGSTSPSAIIERVHPIHGAVSCHMSNGKQESVGSYHISYLELLRGRCAYPPFMRYLQVCRIKWDAGRNHAPKSFVGSDDRIFSVPHWKSKIGSERDSETRNPMRLCRFGRIRPDPMGNDIGFDHLGAIQYPLKKWKFQNSFINIADK